MSHELVASVARLVMYACVLAGVANCLHTVQLLDRLREAASECAAGLAEAASADCPTEKDQATLLLWVDPHLSQEVRAQILDALREIQDSLSIPLRAPRATEALAVISPEPLHLDVTEVGE